MSLSCTPNSFAISIIRSLRTIGRPGWISLLDLTGQWSGPLPWNRRGGCAIKKMVPFLIGADGVVISDPKQFQRLTTPSAPTLVAFGIIFLMARPPLLCKPLQGGEYVLVQHSSPVDGPQLSSYSSGTGRSSRYPTRAKRTGIC